MSDTVKKDILTIISNIARIREDDIDCAAHYSQIGIDSFALLEIVFAVEIKYDIKLSQDALPALTSIDELIKHTKKSLASHE